MHSFVTSKNAQWPRLIWPTLYIGNTRVEHTHISATHVHIYTRAEYTRRPYTFTHMYRINTCGKSGVTGGVLDCVFTEHI